MRHGNVTSVRDVVLVNCFFTLRGSNSVWFDDNVLMILIWTRRIQSFRFKVRPITCASLLHQFEPFGWAGVVTLQGHCWGSPYLDISFGIVHDFLINRIIVRNKLNASWTHINPSGGFLFSSANRVTSIQGRISPVLHGITNSLFTFLIVHLFWLESFHVNFRCEIFHIHYQKITRPTSPRVQGESHEYFTKDFCAELMHSTLTSW